MVKYGLYSFSVNGNPFDILVVADDVLYQMFLGGNDIKSENNPNPEFAAQAIDEILNFPWYVSRFPYSLTGDGYVDWTLRLFINSYPVSDFTDSDVEYDGSVVGTASLALIEYSNYDRSVFNSTMQESFDSQWDFLLEYGSGAVSAGCNIILLQEESIVNNKIVEDSNYIPLQAQVYYIPSKQYVGRVVSSSTIRTIPKIPYTTNEINELPGDDPFEPGGTTGEGGGGGDFDNTSTPIEIPNLPSISAASTGFISLFNPSLSQLNELASYLWSDLFEIDGWKKLFADPMDAILGLSILPVSIPSGGTREVKVGNIGTGKYLTVAASQFVEVDCGSIDVNEYWGAYLDYEPYTQAQIFLPYIGTRPISVDEIMGKTVRVVYHVDILTGACCCFVKCGDSVLYTYNGQCSIPIPITGANYTSVVNGILTIAASAAALVATGGMAATVAVPTLAGVAGAGSAVMGAAQTAVNQMKPQISKSGPVSGAAGLLNMQTPYLILIRPRQALPSKQNEFIGYPSVITVQLTELTGYTEVQSIHLENIPATQEELAEIQSLLMGGVIF